MNRCPKCADNVHTQEELCEENKLLKEEIARLKSQVDVARTALEFYANGRDIGDVAGVRKEFGCGCCAGIKGGPDGTDEYDKDVIGLTAREALAALDQGKSDHA